MAHPGRTDSSGGHHDYNNVSGLGSYHYHHGYSAHLHENGICPYEDDIDYVDDVNDANDVNDIDYEDDVDYVNEVDSIVSTSPNNTALSQPKSMYPSTKWYIFFLASTFIAGYLMCKLISTHKVKVELRKKKEYQDKYSKYTLFITDKYTDFGYSLITNEPICEYETFHHCIIVKKAGIIHMVQCIFCYPLINVSREDISNFYGKYIFYCIDNKIDYSYVRPVLITNSKLSKSAKTLCTLLKITYRENIE